MKNSSFVLLRNLFLSTSRLNLYRHCRDRKKRKKLVAAFIGVGFLDLCVLFVCFLTCIGYGEMGLTDIMPALAAFIVAIISFVFTLLKTNGYLFNFKEYDMLMSLPFSAKTVAGCKFLYMYLTDSFWSIGISLVMMVAYGMYVRPDIWVYPVWIVLTLFVPLIPMLIASFLGFLIARVSSGMRKKTLIQTLLTFVAVSAVIWVRIIVEKMMRNDEYEEILNVIFDGMEKIKKIYLPAKWFENAVVKGSILDIILLVGVSIALFEGIFYLVGRSYREINSKLKSHVAAKKFRMTEQKAKSVLNSIAFKELKRMTGSSLYITNVGLGVVFAIAVAIAAPFVDLDKVLNVITQNSPITKEIIIPAIPLILYFFLGMMPTSVPSPSLEGKNYWIVKSLPITPEELYRGKMLFNMYLTVPPMALATLSLGISAGMTVLNLILSLVLGFTLLAFSTTWGCVCGIKHMRLDWENEVEVIKQSTATVIYLMPNMLMTMLLVFLAAWLGTFINVNLILLALIILSSGAATLAYFRALALAKKK